MKQSDPAASPDGSSGSPPIDWQAIFQRHERWLRTVILARLGEPQAVEEVFQEVCLAAVRQQSPLADVTKVAPWLYRLAIRQALLYRRKQGRRRRATDRYARETLLSPKALCDGDPLGWLLAEERCRLVRMALNKLPKRDVEILLLKYTEDWSYRQMGEHLGITASAVQARLHRARQRLRAELAKFEADAP